MTNSEDNKTPLCVDLDGTIIKGDLLHESLLLLLKRNILYLFLLPFWLLKGKAQFKSEIAKRVSLDVAHLSYNAEVVSFLREQYQEGRRLILATASNERYAAAVSSHLGIFSEVLGSNEVTNLSGSAKAALLENKFGKGGFDYLANSRKDIPIWTLSKNALVVCTNESLLAEVQRVIKVFNVPGINLLSIIKAMRPYQWVKNLLLFVPVVMAHRFLDAELLCRSLFGFLAFSVTASGVYVLNDLVDIGADRQHRRKKRRPFASGDLPITLGLLMVPILIGVGMTIASFISKGFLFALLIYFITTTSYSFYLKSIAVVDIVVLSLLYMLRILAGGIATEVAVSQWLLAFSVFLFFSLACVKRFSELKAIRELKQRPSNGRGYFASDLEQISQFGSSSAYISVLVFALYIRSAEVTVLYRFSDALWALCPVLLYWLSRLWLLAHRGLVHDDPIVFAIRDLVSYIVGLLSLSIVLFAI